MSTISQEKRDHINELYNKNIQSIKSVNPSLYDKLIVLSPKRVKLSQTSDGVLNITIGDNNLYPDNPEIVCAQQLHQFFSYPKTIYSNVKNDPDFKPETCKTLNQLHLGALQNQYHHIQNKNKVNSPSQSPFIFIAGVGLGLHIGPLCEKSRNIIIYEPDIEIFFLSLFSIDYSIIIQKMSQPLRSILFSVGKTPEQCLQLIYNNYHTDKSYLLTNTQLFVHYVSPEFKNDLERILSLWHRVYSVSGFIEDELFGLNHWAKTLEKDPHFILDQLPKYNLDAPVLVIGSGPSLTNQLDLIRQHQEKIVIISCSSSLHICHRNGITPDFHAEMERNEVMLNMIRNFEDKPFLKKITLLSLHTIHPDMASYFKGNINAFKENDLSLSIMREIVARDIHGQQFFFPSAGNAGLGFATALGFSTIYAAGLDFAYETPEEHHARDTEYYGESAQNPVARMEHQLSVKATEGGEIGTSVMLDSARFNAERLAHENPDVRYINLSKGAYIHGFNHNNFCNTLFTDKCQIDKEKTLLQAYENTRQFTDINLSKETVATELKKRWNRHIRKSNIIVKSLSRLLVIPQSKIELVFDWLDIINHEFLGFSQKHPVQAIILGGTLSTLQTLTAATLIQMKDGQEMEYQMKIILKIWHEHLASCMIVLNESYKKSSDEISIKKFIPATQKIYNAYTKPDSLKESCNE